MGAAWPRRCARVRRHHRARDRRRRRRRRDGPGPLAAGRSSARCLGLVALALSEGFSAVAAIALAGAAWYREPRARAGPEFSRRVMLALMLCATAAITLLTVGQFVQVADVAAVLATLSVLTGTVRSGLTVVERLGRATAARDHRRPHGARQPPPPARAARRASRRPRATRDGRAAARRPRRLQGAQRHPRPPRRRRAAAPDRRRACRRCCAPRHARPARRRRVRGRARPRATRPRRAPGRGCAPRSRSPSRSAGSACTSTPSVGIALFPRHAQDRGAAAARRRRDVRGQAHAHRPRGLSPVRDPHSRGSGSRCRASSRRGSQAGELVAPLPAEGRRSRPARCAGSRRSCAGTIPARAARAGRLPAAGRAERADARADRRSCSTRRSRRSAPPRARASSSASRSTSVPPTCSTSAPLGGRAAARLHAVRPRAPALEVSEDVVMADPERTVEC